MLTRTGIKTYMTSFYKTLGTPQEGIVLKA